MDKRTPLFTSAEAAVLCGGRCLSLAEHGEKISGNRISGISIDSRSVLPGDLFVALEGERSDGHRYLKEASEAGAAALLVSASKIALLETIESWEEAAAQYGIDIIVSENSLSALQRMGKSWLEQFPELLRIAITGSSGKTTTKELLGSVLSCAAATTVSKGNFNSDIGLPLALFSLNGETRYGVFELGINRIGEMDLLASIFAPHYVLITNIGTAHSGPLGGAEGVFQEKSRIFAHMLPGGTAFLPVQENRIDRLRDMFPAVRFVTYGPKCIEGLEHIDSLGIEGFRLTYYGEDLVFPLSGEHNLRNAAGVMALAQELGISPEDVAKGLSETGPVEGRCYPVRGYISIIDDSYNANPDSVRKVLHYFRELPCEGKKMVVFGSMKELGDDLAAAHGEMGKELALTGASEVFLFGNETKHTLKALEESNFPGSVRWFGDDDFLKLSRTVTDSASKGDLVLLKGSRAMELDRLVPVLRTIKEEAHA
jgi:UDP-N-acetylmuramoyl-tripeptide--D-alanyl-D-alanine ligase